jgi:tetratricopeptide (TPR) repeat protein
MKFRIKFQVVIISLAFAAVVSGCRQYTNFTTYYNTYYNMDRLTGECEDEFEFQDEKKRIEPRIFIPQPDIYTPDEHIIGPPPFMVEFIVSKQKRQPVQIKLDSIIIKGSKILAYKAKSNYVEGSLWLMSKSFFYQEDWMNSQVKCSELIDKFPGGDFSPDAHLLYSKNLLVQRKYEAGEIMLSRTVDIAWQKKRYDILSEAFRIEAELALYQSDFEKALRPYRQAITQSDDGQLKARWQLDLAALLYRTGYFEKAIIEFRKVRKYSPDYVQKFESYLYEASCLARIKDYKEADEMLDDLYNDGKFEEWRSFTVAQQLNVARLKSKDTSYIPPPDLDPSKKIDLSTAEIKGDSSYATSAAMIAYYFERGVDFYYDHDYQKARNYFAKSRMKRTPAFTTSNKMFDLLNNWDIKRQSVEKFKKIVADTAKPATDSIKMQYANDLYALGRIHEELKNKDSVVYYYKLAAENAPLSLTGSSQHLHNFARVVRDKDPRKADSLLDVIVFTHPLTEFGKDAQNQLGYTKNFVIDTVAELYYSGANLQKFGDYPFAISQFTKVFEKYPVSKFAAKSLYTVGWIFEHPLHNYDSALYYYKLLLEKYPNSEYADDIRLGVAFKVVLNNGDPIPDSLKTKQVVIPMPSEPLKGIPPKIIPPSGKFNQRKSLDPKELLQNPGNILKEAGKLIDNPVEMLKSLDVPTNAADFFKQVESKVIDSLKIDMPLLPKDSTNIKLPEQKNEEPQK